MNWLWLGANNFWPKYSAVIVIALLLTACKRDDTKVYRVAKEQSPAPQPQVMPPGHPEINSSKPQLSWKLPEGWQEAGAGKMSLATFNIAGSNGGRAQVTITPLRGLAGKEALIVNMWRQQVGLPELSPEEVNQQLQPVEIGGEPGKMFEVAGKSDTTNPPVRIITAMKHVTDTSWFYKFAGDADVVEAQKPAFIAFLKSIKITEAPAETVAATPASVPASADSAPAAPSEWKIPADWKRVSPGPMQAAKFSVPEVGGAKADVTISVFPNSTGGTLGNVNRWRNQIGLAPVEESGLAQIVEPLDAKIPEAVIADLSNGSRRLVGAIVPGGGQWYFYKLLGDEAALAPQKEAFIKFVKEVKY